MKRLYARSRFRGLGIGRALALAVIQTARHLGYRRLRLDTLPSMRAAMALYKGLGFKPLPPRPHPVRGAKFFELDLEA